MGPLQLISLKLEVNVGNHEDRLSLSTIFLYLTFALGSCELISLLPLFVVQFSLPPSSFFLVSLSCLIEASVNTMAVGWMDTVVTLGTILLKLLPVTVYLLE